jgi:hypothetical protein
LKVTGGESDLSSEPDCCEPTVVPEESARHQFYLQQFPHFVVDLKEFND